jgi:hypothetical protein
MGAAALTQPGYLLFPAAIFVFEVLRRSGLVSAAVRTAVFFLAMLIAIAPWTYRNYRVFHQFVLIATNGGYVFDAANSASSDPFAAPEADIALPKDELAANRLGYQEGEDWIKHNPGAFAALMVKKQIVTVGDDGIGAFESLKRGLSPGVALYASAKGVSNLYWLALWTLLLLGFPLLFACTEWRLWFGLLFVPTIYQWAIDSVFVSGSRHHQPYISLTAIMVGIVLGAARSATGESAREGADTAAALRP